MPKPKAGLAERFAGRTALITGAAGGIGAEIARLLHGSGVKLVLVDIAEDALAALAAELDGAPRTIVADISRLDAIRSLRERVDADGTGLDILVNNAAILTLQPFETCPLERIELEYRVNLLAPTLLAREFFELLRASGDGRIVTIVSLAALVALAESPVYSASKFGLRGAMLAIGARYREHGITVGSILPSSVDTPMLREEALHGGSVLNFLDPPQKPERIARELERMLLQPRVERFPKSSDALLCQITNLFPALARPLGRILESRARAGLVRYLRERDLLTASEHPSLARVSASRAAGASPHAGSSR